MNQPSSFSIYNASAGSGKTFTLVKVYLSKLLLSNRPEYFKTILAITFTNKAVGEMKKRIMETLQEFANEKILAEPSVIFLEVQKDTGLTENEIHLRSKKALNYILHNYASFDVETIDRFNHRLIRTFAKDLKLSSNFDVELEIEALLNEAVDRVIARAGKDEKLTAVLLDFTFEKVEDDKSWDITTDLQQVSKLLTNENDRAHVELMKNRSLEDFSHLKKIISAQIKAQEEKIIAEAKKFISTVHDSGLTFGDFSGNHVENYFEKLCSRNFDVGFEAGWQKSFGEKPLHRAKEKEEIISIFNSITPQLSGCFFESKNLICRLQLLKTIRAGISSMSLLNTIYNEYKLLQEEKNILPISEFNARIFKEIKGQPAPFIYERLGDRYKHFFIDEFQDTSQLQWQNLIPLIDNAISQEDIQQETGSLLLVGDAKQSIYRWRGGFPEQFIELCNLENPFSVQNKNISTLETNYRSHKEIIKFNNSFFTHIAPEFHLDTHQALYTDGNKQLSNSKEGGFVSIDFIDAQNKEEEMELYPEKVLEIVKAQRAKGFKAKDICILTRKKAQGVAIGKLLSENDIPIISSESLLLVNSPYIRFCVGMLKLAVNFNNLSVKADVLYFLHDHFKTSEEKHPFIDKFLNTTEKEFSRQLKEYDVDFTFNDLSFLPLYEVCEEICNSFFITPSAVAYVQYFLDIVLEFSTQKQADIPAFLEYWENNCEKLSIEVSGTLDAVQIMTIHKAKGLEFPVVIYPFADDVLFESRNEKVWFPLPPEEFNGFTEFHIPLNKNLQNFGLEGEAIYNLKKSQAELDTINVLYVALTRAAEQLFILSNSKNATKEGTVTKLFVNYLKNESKWDENQTEFTFGIPEKISESKADEEKPVILENLISSNKQDHNILISTRASLLWDTIQQQAIEKGNLVHVIMAGIQTKNDVSMTLDKFISEGFINVEQSTQIRNSIDQIIDHPQLATYFKDNVRVENEREIFTKEGYILRPDRLNFLQGNQIVIIDYKTGSIKEEHKLQIDVYASALMEMGFTVYEKLLVYVDDKIRVVKV